jgi:hypothetical protein
MAGCSDTVGADRKDRSGDFCMIFPSNPVRIMVAPTKVDFRKAHDGLSRILIRASLIRILRNSLLTKYMAGLI